ncbi:50S ribosomal protein L29 [Patescibacteria group bacterium]|nr:50S ribosomal protein L29 [Patescibacteria group bacterium]
MKKSVKELNDKTVSELEKQLNLLKEEIAKFKLSETSSPQKNTNLLFKKRKQLAVLLTVLEEKKIVASLKK